MRIAGIQVMNLVADYPARRGFRFAGGMATGRLTSLVCVVTEEGLTGWGSAYSYPDLMRVIIEDHLQPFLLGQDPLQTEALWDMMYRLTRWYGRKGAAISALGALDIALWDLRGKALGQPVCRLLGSQSKAVPAYASALLWHDDLRELEQEASRLRNGGFRRMKMRLGRNETYDVAALDAVCRGAGADGEVMVDGSLNYTLPAAEKLAQELAARKVFWFEEPFPPEDLDSYVALRSRVSVPLAAGENDFGVQGFREMLRAGALDIVQPDACRAGGITECLRIGRMAAEMGARVATHTWNDAIALMANAHVIAALPNGITVEVDRTGNPFIESLLAQPLQIEDGFLQLPDAPGLGVDPNPATIERFMLPAGARTPDGNYGDLIFGPGYLGGRSPAVTGAHGKAGD